MYGTCFNKVVTRLFSFAYFLCKIIVSLEDYVLHVLSNNRV